VAAHKKEIVMIPRIVYMEPELWDICERRGQQDGITRSTWIRKAIKRELKECSKIEGINWQE
jgi:hypothetical protein